MTPTPPGRIKPKASAKNKSVEVIHVQRLPKDNEEEEAMENNTKTKSKTTANATNEKEEHILGQFNALYTHTNNDTDKIKLLDVFNTISKNVPIKLYYLDFVRIVKLNKIHIDKSNEKLPYFLIGYKTK